jgi:glycosyltransferase involved in cell wall biosynthesis
MTIQVSVVVPTYQRPELLQRCLAALVAQEFDPTAYEVIVVDDAASAETKSIVEGWLKRAAPDKAHSSGNGWAEPDYLSKAVSQSQGTLLRVRGESRQADSGRVERTQAQLMVISTQLQNWPGPVHKNGASRVRRIPSLRYIATPNRCGPAAARNCGWRAARGPIIAFTDDDCLPEPDWLKAGMLAFGDGVVGVGGWVSVPLPKTPTDYERNSAGLEGIQFVTANCFYRREALAAVGGFDERFTSAWREDSDLFFSLLEYYDGDSRLVHASNAIVVHPVRPAPWGVSLGQQRKSMFNALVYKKHPVLYRELIQPAPPWRYYGLVGVLLVALASVLAGYQGLALLAGGTWLFLTGNFCRQRLSQTSRAPVHIAEMVVTSALIPPLAVFWRIWGAFKFRVFFL